MRVDAPVQLGVNPNHVLEPQFAAQAGVSNNMGRVPMAGQVTGNAAYKKDSSIYDFNTYAEGLEGVRLLVRNGFDPIDLWLVGKGRAGERRSLSSHGNGDRIKSEDRYDPFWDRVSGFVFESARKTGPQMLMMHGNSVEASKAHCVLVEHAKGAALARHWLQQATATLKRYQTGEIKRYRTSNISPEGP